MTMHCLPQRLKSRFLKYFLNGGSLKGTQSEEKISKNVDFSFWGNRANTYLKLDFFFVLARDLRRVNQSAGPLFPG